MAESTLERPIPSRGDWIGRYVVLGEIAAGGMGVVLAAYDPDLDRKIALKLLLPSLAESDGGTSARKRLTREAQAMARLSHPNVVTVHDVGDWGDQIFIAMEHVEGMTLGEWFRETGRPWREVVEAFLRAGRGLAAAHAADIVHRDFKPANVLVGGDGRVRVTDFGIAGHAAAALPDAVSEHASAGLAKRRTTGGIGGDLTQDGAFLGTAGYAAPEQLTGNEVDPRSDQFSFCVALYEALYGDRPFHGSTLFDLLVAIEEQRIAPPPPGRDVPDWLRAIVLHGLRADPSARYASMDALLAELTARPESHFSGVWDDARRQTIRDAFLATGVPFAETAWESVVKVLDRYADAWIEGYNDAWEATHIRHEQTQEIFDLRALFLEQRRQELRALTDLFAAADGTVVEAAVEAAHGLTDVSAASDLTTIRLLVLPPQDQETRQRVDAIREKLAHVQALQFANKFAEGLEAAVVAVAEASAVDYRPVYAEALALHGDLLRRAGHLEEAEKTLTDAVIASDACRHDRIKAKALIDLVFVVGYRMALHSEGHTWGRFAEAAVERVGGDDVLMARLYNNIGGVYWSQGEYDRALEYNRRALELRERTLGAEHPAVADSLNNLGVVCWRKKLADQAVEHYRRALAIFEGSVGPRHPNVAAALSNLGAVLSDQGKYGEALEQIERALDILESSFGPEHPRVASTLKKLGGTHLAAGDAKRAVEPLERALRVREQQGKGAASIGSLRFALARAVWESGDMQRAFLLAEEAKKNLQAAGVSGAAELGKLTAWLKRTGQGH